jgi:hypothetical protein
MRIVGDAEDCLTKGRCTKMPAYWAVPRALPTPLGK